jgi:glyoxylase-like metal-dependent hydrolase (beta-lactamase superfamily II)
VPRLLEALSATGRSPADVRHIIVTHVHLDHAGGTSALSRLCPGATVLCHPRAERHLVDPGKLIESSRQVYGEAQFERLYGEILPIPAARVRALADGEEVALGARTLRFLHTRGHANHHFCILDADDGSIFTGDSFGVAYPFLQSAGLFVFPTTTPTDFDPIEARRSVERIVATGAARAYPTHFGELADLPGAAAQLLPLIDECGRILEAAVRSELTDRELERFCLERWGAAIDAALAARGLQLSPSDAAFMALDRGLNAQGLAVAASRLRSAAARSA